MNTITLDLPWPPSVNTIWRHTATGGSVRTYLSQRGASYYANVLDACQSYAGAAGKERVAVHIAARPPDRRKRDLDNICKAVLDGLTRGRVWDDDCQIDYLSVERGSVTPGGSVVVTIERIGGA